MLGWCWSWIPRRYIICFLCFLAMMISYIMRFCLSIAITEMVRSHHKNSSYIAPGTCPYDDLDPANSVPKDRGEFTWSEETQGIVLSSFFWGYVVTQVPGGLLAERIGGKYTLAGAILVPAICSLLTPLAARQGVWYLVGLRIIMGFGQGFVYPSLNALLAKWAPVEERGRLGTLVFAGANFGNIVSNLLSGLLLSWTEGMWSILFYLYGGAALFWLWMWSMYGYSRPEDHPGLSTSERKYLEKYSAQVHMQTKLPPTPWRGILTSVPLWGLVVAQIGHDWGLFTIITDLPKYMKSVMHFSIAQTGVRAALPYVAMCVVALFAGGLVDFLLAKKLTTITVSRKIFTTVASLGPAVGIVGASYAECDKQTVTLFFILGMGLMGFFYPSLKVNCLDLSPNYAGTVMALVNGIGAISGIITPYLVGLLITDNTMEQWRSVFLIAAAVLLLTNLVYVCTASGEVQPWNEPPAPVDPEAHRHGVRTIATDDLTVYDSQLGFRKTKRETY
uniref:Major facilitator superfamily (MFS) profile domain-containing protein n=1 Tax=Graphocephala atropunctata TaxID=36148 RepID=A0A1B6LST4_9HEMI